MWMLLIYVLSAQPKLPQAPGPLWDVLLKKAAHLAEYAILFALLWRAWAARPRRFSPLGLAWLLTVLYAASDEFHQTFVPGRNGSAWDVLVDGMGATLAALGVWWSVRSR
jgi:VanZ family protein